MPKIGYDTLGRHLLSIFFGTKLLMNKNEDTLHSTNNVGLTPFSYNLLRKKPKKSHIFPQMWYLYIPIISFGFLYRHIWEVPVWCALLLHLLLLLLLLLVNSNSKSKSKPLSLCTLFLCDRWYSVNLSCNSVWILWHVGSPIQEPLKISASGTGFSWLLMLQILIYNTQKLGLVHTKLLVDKFIYWDTNK